MKLFSNDLGVDLGTCNVRIYADNKGVMVNEPSVVSMDKNTGRILKVGSDARNMLGRTPGNVVATHPLKKGVVSDHDMTVKLLQELLRLSRHRAFRAESRRSQNSKGNGRKHRDRGKKRAL